MLFAVVAGINRPDNSVRTSVGRNGRSRAWEVERRARLRSPGSIEGASARVQGVCFSAGTRTKMKQRVLPKRGRREGGAGNRQCLHNLIVVRWVVVSQVGAVQDIQNALFSAADQKVGMCANVVNQNGGPASPHVGIISVEAELVVGRKPIHETKAASRVELENTVSQRSGTVPDAVSGQNIQAACVVDGICGWSASGHPDASAAVRQTFGGVWRSVKNPGRSQIRRAVAQNPAMVRVVIPVRSPG